ncbi:MAG: 23S rRNA (adenine(2503)-C(2))-methyltransferase RlmN [Lachnospiraceae bacterium]|jgi:23S rRNA (adenine2503-C2)-methyltransferase|nr:23S rRNA (adenine(2503)-C(2))-methyltransferase RlmN [Lachnospiraceae bacterium]
MKSVERDQKDMKSMNIEELQSALQQIGEKPFRADQIYAWMHNKLAKGFEDMTNVSKELRVALAADYSFPFFEPAKELISQDGQTHKYLFPLDDGNAIETVRMKYKHGTSVCISTQVGCKMSCAFCASGQDGFVRQLTTSEMLEQIYAVSRLSGERISHVVIMGTGEPLDNYDNVLRMIRMLTDERGLNISQRNITLSTCGVVPAIYELAKERLQITLAISLHAAKDDIRKRLMPIANRYSIEELEAAIEMYQETTNRRVTLEYILIKGINDQADAAVALSRLAGRLRAHVNLIPVNAVAESGFVRPTMQVCKNFQNTLEKKRIHVTMRREMGKEVNASCGQLRREVMAHRQEEDESDEVLFFDRHRQEKKV